MGQLLIVEQYMRPELKDLSSWHCHVGITSHSGNCPNPPVRFRVRHGVRMAFCRDHPTAQKADQSTLEFLEELHAAENTK